MLFYFEYYDELNDVIQSGHIRSTSEDLALKRLKVLLHTGDIDIQLHHLTRDDLHET